LGAADRQQAAKGCQFRKARSVVGPGPRVCGGGGGGGGGGLLSYAKKVMLYFLLIKKNNKNSE